VDNTTALPGDHVAVNSGQKVDKPQPSTGGSTATAMAGSALVAQDTSVDDLLAGDDDDFDFDFDVVDGTPSPPADIVAALPLIEPLPSSSTTAVEEEASASKLSSTGLKPAAVKSGQQPGSSNRAAWLSSFGSSRPAAAAVGPQLIEPLAQPNRRAFQRGISANTVSLLAGQQKAAVKERPAAQETASAG
jgi:hypothetical protein